MEDVVRSPLVAWDSFYVIIGSSAAALTGLQFVVMALASDRKGRGTPATIAAFGTPTIVHFCAALLVAAIACAPWSTLSSPAIAMGCCGAAGVGYVGLVIKRARRQEVYRPVLEDWIWHAVLPVLAYGGLLIAALSLTRISSAPPFGVASAALLLVFIGIHNAWDAATYLAADVGEPSDEPKSP